VFLSIVIIATACVVGLVPASAEKNVDFNILALESILNNRYWIIESLVNNDFSNNPYAKLCNGASKKNKLMDELLSNYENNAAFKLLVDALQLGENYTSDLSGMTANLISSLLSIFGISDESALATTLESFAKTSGEIRYEDIINDVLSTDYTSSWGSKLFDSELDIEHYRQMAKILKNISAYQKALSDQCEVLGLNVDYDVANHDSLNKMESDEIGNMLDYVDHFLGAYEDSLYDALVYLCPDEDLFTDNEAVTKKIIGATALAFAYKSEKNAMVDSYSDTFCNYFYNYFCDDLNKVLTVGNKLLKLPSLATQYSIILESLAAQKDTTVKVMERIRDNSDSQSIKKVMRTYSNMVDEEGNANLLDYDVIVDQISHSSKIGSYEFKKSKKVFDSFLNNKKLFKDFITKEGTNKLTEGLISAGKCVKIAIWVADKATNIKETAKKIYICKSIQNLINEAVKTYNNDYAIYLSDKTDENAKNCLDDLEFLKKLRLYGEKQAYGGTVSLPESIVGLLLGGGELSKDIAQHYQGNVDSLLGCSLTASAVDSFTVKSGETLSIYPYKLDSGKLITYALLNKEDGTNIDFPEADRILGCELIINGGTVNISTSADGALKIFFPSITITGNSQLNLYGSEIAVGQFINSGNLSISLNYHKKDAALTFTETIENSGTITFVDDGHSYRCQDISNSGTINMGESTLSIYGDVNNNGNFSGTVNVCGDGTKIYDEGYFSSGIQTVSGEGGFSYLRFNNHQREGIRVSGAQTVSSYYSDTGVRVRMGENIILTSGCQIAGNTIKNNISFKDFNSSNAITVNGIGCVKGDTAFGGKTVFKDDLIVNSGNLVVNAPTDVKGSLIYKSGTVSGSSPLKLYSDAIITASSPSVSNLEFSGSKKQSLTTSNALSVGSLNNANSSLNGVDISGTVNVNDSISNNLLSKFTNSKNIVLNGAAAIGSNPINGDLSAKDWTNGTVARIKGSLYSSSTVNINSNLKVLGYNQSSGKLNIAESAELECLDYFKQSAETVNSGKVLVKGDAKIDGAFSGGSIEIKGDTAASAAFSPDELIFNSKLAQTFNNSSTTSVKKLEINNNSDGGFTVGSVINVSEEYINNCKNLINSENIILEGLLNYSGDSTYKGDLKITGEYTIPSGNNLTVRGNLVLSGNAVLNIENGAKLTVKGGVVSNSATLNVSQGGSLTAVGYLNSNSDTLNIDGNLIVKSDAKLTSSTVNAEGMITFNGNLNTSSCTWNNPNVSFISKLSQTLSGSAITVNNLVIDNASRDGLTLSATVNYYGTLNKNNSVISDESKLVKNS